MPRKKPYSNKQKKKQLQEKREKKNPVDNHGGDVRNQGVYGECNPSVSEEEPCSSKVQRLNVQPVNKGQRYDPNRYKLHFLRDSDSEVERRKEISRQPFESVSEKELEVGLEDVYDPGSVLDMPKRPEWNYALSKGQLDAKEERYFQDYLENVFEKYGEHHLSYFELNLETWRQLWRVLEMSDIILIIADARHPVLQFPPTLYDYVVNHLNKHIILVLNKIDLVSSSLVVAWKHYFQKRFPEVHIVMFTSFSSDIEDKDGDHIVMHKKRQKKSYTTVGPKQLLKACQDIVNGNVDLTSWEKKIDHGFDEHDFDDGVLVYSERADSTVGKHVRYKDGILTIGCCGYPNVGKSSLLNGLVGKKVVSTSRTPGHTKHFQTIFLTPTVKLCDSPGLVFPSLVSKPLQILSGIYPVAQVREPYTAVGYMAQRIPLVDILRIKHPSGVEESWTAWDICDAWAEKRNFKTHKTGRNDTYRAANRILRLAVEGRLNMCLRPPEYTDFMDMWRSHPETDHISELQRAHAVNTSTCMPTEEYQKIDELIDYEEASGSSEEDADDSLTVHISNPFDLLNEDD